MSLPDAGHKDYFDKVVRFFDDLLRKGSPCRLTEEYPLVFGNSETEVIEIPAEHPELHEQGSAQSNSYLFVLSDQGDYRAGLGVLRRKLKTAGGRELSVAFVGSVVTSPEYRQRGFQKILFRAVEQMLKPKGVELVVLWSNQLEFYQKLGFQLSGLQATWGGLKDVKLGAAPSEIVVEDSSQVEFKEGWFSAYSQKQFSIERTINEMKLLFKIPQMKIAYTERAYALMGKGEDFQSICHEWAGPAEDVLSCIDALRVQEPKLRIMSPGFSDVPEELAVLKAFEAKNYESRLEYLGLFKALQSDFVMEDLDPEKLRLPFFIWGLDSI